MRDRYTSFTHTSLGAHPKDCNSIQIYKKTKSKQDINKQDPKLLNNTIKE